MRIQVYIVVLLAALFTSCNEYTYNEGFIYGTMYHIVYDSPDDEDYQAEITQKLNEFNLIFSTYEPQSVISKINNNEPVEIDSLFIECFNRSVEISELTNGAFDITAGPMVNAWGFGPEERSQMTDEKIDSLKLITGYQKIRLEDDRIVKENPNMKLDMSAVAKGYTCDLIADFLKEKGCEDFMVEIGGEVVALGENESGRIWSIGISKPEDDSFFAQNELQAIVELPADAMATSGNYRNYYVEDGQKYAHTIDPKTGYPVQHSLLSATVIANDCMTADAFATAFMVMGLEEGIELLERVPELKVYFIYADENGENAIYMSENFEPYLKE